MDLRHGADGGAGIAAGGFLVDGDGGGQSLDRVHVRFFHLAQELPRIGGQAFDVPPLTLRVNRIKGEGAFAGAAEPGEHHQFIPWDGQVHVLEVMLSCAAYNQLIVTHFPPHSLCFAAFRSPLSLPHSHPPCKSNTNKRF